MSKSRNQAASESSDDRFVPNDWREENLSTSRLTSGLPYQRKVDPKEVDRLISQWDLRLLEPISVSFRDGKNYVIDGQHRIAAMVKMNGGRECRVSCKVIEGLTYEQEAALCYKLDKAKRRLALTQSMNALAEAGCDREVNVVKLSIEKEGFTWALNKTGGNSNNEIASARAVMNAYNLLGLHEFTRMLRLLRSTWNGERISLTSYMISGLALFLNTYGSEIQDDLFEKQLSKAAPAEIVSRGKADISISHAPLRYARAIRTKYNQNHRLKTLPYQFDE